jgi:hypothetical protein
LDRPLDERGKIAAETEHMIATRLALNAGGLRRIAPLRFR